MTAHISRTSYDHTDAHMVAVIASFDTEGHIRPLYVRIGEDALKVRSSWMKPSYPGIMVFNCQVEDRGQLKSVILTYHPRENVWTVPGE